MLRSDAKNIETRIFIRSQDRTGKWGAQDLGNLDRESVMTWLQDKSDEYKTNLILTLLNHEQF